MNLLVSDEDLECAYDLSERDALVGLPVLAGFCIIDEDDEVLILALVVDLGLLCFASGHDCGMRGGIGLGGVVWFWCWFYFFGISWKVKWYLVCL